MIKDLCFEIIQTCPNKCIFCSSNSCIDAREIIEMDLFKRVIEHFIKLGGIEEISLSGGEPFLHPNLYDMVKYCKDNGIKTIIYSSGVKKRVKLPREEIEILGFNQRRIAEMIQKDEFSGIDRMEFIRLRSLGLDKIVFDFQSIEIEEHDRLMGVSNHLTYVIDSVLRAKFSGLDVGVNFIPNKLNYKQFPDIIEVLNIAEVDTLNILNFVPQGRGKDNRDELKLNMDEMREFTKIFHSLKKMFNGEIKIGIPLLSNGEHLCTAGYDKLDIKYDGTVLPCPAFKETDLSEYGFKSYNIHTDLDKIMVAEGERNYPLCRQVYGFQDVLE